MEVGAPEGVTSGAGGKKGAGRRSEKQKKQGRTKDTKGGATEEPRENRPPNRKLQMDYINVDEDDQWGANEPEESPITMRARVLRAQDTCDEDFESTIARLKQELEIQTARADAAEKNVAEYVDQMTSLQEKLNASSIYHERVMTMVNYAVGPMQAELDAKKAETSKLLSTIGGLNARADKADSDLKAALEVRARFVPLNHSLH